MSKKIDKPKEFDQYLVRPEGIMPSKDFDTINKLDQGIYNVVQTRMGDIYFTNKTFNHDQLLDLPKSQYSEVMDELEVFLSPGAVARFKETGLLYKSSLILYGRQGTGKTSIVMQVANKVVNSGGIVLFDPAPSVLKKAYRVLEQIEPTRFVLVILEEFDRLGNEQEEELLNILDGENQRNNTMVIATTNHINRISKRLLRPGRFQNKIEVFEPSAEARRYYLGRKIKDKNKVDYIVEHTNRFTIDELCEVVRSHYCLSHPLDQVITRITGQATLGKGVATRLGEVTDDTDKVALQLGHVVMTEMVKNGHANSVAEAAEVASKEMGLITATIERPYDDDDDQDEKFIDDDFDADQEEIDAEDQRRY